MKTIFRKVLAKERLPKKNGVYIALRSGFLMGDWIWKDGEWQDEENTGSKYELEWWLEEIELPSDADLIKAFGEKTNRMWLEGAKWMKHFVLAATPK